MGGVVGHRVARLSLARAVQAGQVRHAYLFTGPDAIGKTTLAREFAALLECREPNLTEGVPCGVCASCVRLAHGNHPDVSTVELGAGKRLLSVEAVRDIIYTANLAPTESAWRIYLLPEVERLTPSAVNALLKTLEEPPPAVVLLLTSNDPDLLLPTLLSRCQSIALHPLGLDDVTRALIDDFQVSPDEARALAALANGRLGWAVRAARDPALREQRADELRTLTTLTSASRDERLRLAGQLAADGETARRVLDLWLLWWRDVTLAAHGADHLATTGNAREQALRQGHQIGQERAREFLRALVQAQALLEQNANPRLTFEVLLFDLPVLSAMPVVGRP